MSEYDAGYKAGYNSAERWHDDVDHASIAGHFERELIEALAENKRLRAALERIAGGDGYYPDYARAVLYGSEHNVTEKENG